MPEYGDNMFDDRNYLFNFDALSGDENNAKLNEDRYELYVNSQYIGNKTLLNAGDKLSDVDDFLKAQGFSNFTSKLNGDHYEIEAAADDQNGIQDALSVYVRNR